MNQHRPQTQPQNRDQGRAVAQNSGEMKSIDALMEYVHDYARERPERFALYCLGVGFILGWRLKPW